MQRVVFSLVAVLLLGSEVLAADFSAIAAPASDRFDGWFAGGFWSNPFGSFRADHGTLPQSSASLNGSLFGATGGLGFQRGMLYAGFSGSLAGGMIEGQSQSPSCAGNCYASLNAFGEATLSIGVVFRQQLLLYVGGGPNFAVMRSGQTEYGLNEQFVSGEHGTLGTKYAVDAHWSFSTQIERVRIGDLYYNIPQGTIGVNTHDFWMGTLGFEYRF